jgi:serine/threonine protein phosphatase PrpC/serine/threonine protein kinase
MSSSGHQNDQPSILQGSMSVAKALQLMATAIQQGDFTTAEAIGASASIPLSIAKESLHINGSISEGAQATVHSAQLHGHDNPVAVKRGVIRETSDLIRLRRELIFLEKFKSHPNIVQIIGARMIPPNYQIILELEATNAACELYNKETNWRPGWPGALYLGAQLASAIAYMHENDVIHRDIKPANVLLSKNKRTARLADLGIALSIKHDGSTSTGGSIINTDEKEAQSKTETWQGAGKPSGGFYKRKMVGTLEYMAPEILLKSPHSPASDIFALAVTLNEIASGGAVPYSDCTRDNPLAHTILEMGYGRQELAAAVVAEGLRPTIAPNAPVSIVRLLRSCWDADYTRRPSAKEVALKLAALSAQHPWEEEEEEEISRADNTEKLVVTSLPPSSSTMNLDGELITPQWAQYLLQEYAASITTLTTTTTAAAASATIGSFATAGARGEDRMEDRCTIIRSLFGLQHVSLAAVYDGHRGAACAEYLASNLERHLEHRWSTSSSAGELLKDALLDADVAFRQQEVENNNKNGSSKNTATYPGSTAVVALFVGRRFAVAHVGDSRAVLCSKNNQAVAITVDQSAEREDERVRIQNAGGEVSVRLGGWRVGQAGLAVTRSIGDADVKNIGVIAEAEIFEKDLDTEDSFLILASDGVWDLIGNQDAVSLVLDTVKQPALCAQRIVLEALARGSKDNVSAVVAFFPYLGQGMGASTIEKVFHAGQLKYEHQAGTKVTQARVAARLVEEEARPQEDLMQV